MYEKYVKKAWEEKGYKVPHPYSRTIKHIFAPDKGPVDELIFSFAILPPQGKTHYHKHDRGELIYVVTGRGECEIEGEKYPLEPDVVFWCPTEVMHGVVNTGDETMKLATVFVPGYRTEELKGSILEAAQRDGTSETKK